MADQPLITRRSILRGIPAVGLTAAVPAIAIAAQPEITPRERVDAAIAELKAAGTALWPAASNWIVRITANPDIPLLITCMTPMGTDMQSNELAADRHRY